MAIVLTDYYNTNDDSMMSFGITGPLTVRLAQVFQPSSSYDISSVKLKLYKSGNPGIITVELQSTSPGAGGENPDGIVLASGTTDGDTLTVDTAGEWREITFSTSYSVAPGVKYAIVVSAQTYNAHWRKDSGGSYENGSMRGVTVGESWGPVVPLSDAMFETYGMPYYLRDYYDVSNTYFPIYTTGITEYQAGQSFTPAISNRILKIALKLFRGGVTGTPGTFNVKIYVADGNGHPTGSALCSGTSDANSLTTDITGGWWNILLGAGAELTAGTKYVIVVDAPSATVLSTLNWNYQNISGTYAGGIAIRCQDGGVTWIDDDQDDHDFRLYSAEPVAPAITDQSSDTTIFAGESTTLSITASGAPTPDYQWYQDEALLSGEIASTVVFTAAAANAGSYTCTATNEEGSVTSAPIVVVVTPNATAFTVDTRELEIFVDFELKLTASVAFDLLSLVPRKFHGKEEDNWFRDYIKEAALQFGDWFTKLRDIVKLENPYTVSTMKFLRHLGYIIGVNFPSEDNTSELEMRKTLAQAIDWYKIKGTYEAIQILALIHQFTINLYDMYTNDYASFYLTEWFVGDEDENPTGFDDTYYKSPHFGLEVVLNKVLAVASDRYLWQSGAITNFALRVDETRPVHTVPHYLILLNPKTDELGHTIEVDGEIFTKAGIGWSKSSKWFDMIGSGEAWNFDDGVYFDQSQDAFIDTINKWVLGTGNYPCSLGTDTVVGLETPVLEGLIDASDIVVTDEKITWTFIVPKATVQAGITELGLYTQDSGAAPMILSCFPKIDKGSDVELRVVVEMYKKDLS